LDARIRKETGLSVNVIDDPLLCVCKGAARILEDLDKYRPVLISSTI
jgi:rod shape-determining protein MreB